MDAIAPMQAIGHDVHPRPGAYTWNRWALGMFRFFCDPASAAAAAFSKVQPLATIGRRRASDARPDGTDGTPVRCAPM